MNMCWLQMKMTGLESERTRVRAPLMPLEGGKCKYLCKCSLSPEVFPALDWGTIPSPFSISFSLYLSPIFIK